MVTTITHQRSIHIDAPVEKVFDYLKDPHHTYTVISQTPTSRIDRHVTGELTDTTMTRGCGVGTTYTFRSTLLGLHADATYTRQQFLPNQRIVDDNIKAGTTVTFDVEPDTTGTTLSLTYATSTRFPLLSRLWDRLYWDADHDIDAMLHSIRNAVET
jgi:uncharacterized protein YndB with AHSA1/START domain